MVEEIIESSEEESKSSLSDKGTKVGAGLRFIKSKAVCRRCRRLGLKLFLKGEKCSTPKCPFSNRSYAPGQHGQKRSRLSDYGRHLQEKQKLAAIYILKENQLRLLVKEAISFKEDSQEKIVQLLETRLDSIAYVLGWGRSRVEARKLIISGHICVNGKKNDRPGYRVKPKDVISLADKVIVKKLYKDILLPSIKDKQIPEYLKRKNETEATLIRLPKFVEINLFNIQLPLVIEFYSR